ncbi:hypothetical protein HU200_028859 [Digitaria exilis]|uniref:Uncharacterized protein n=1 Tax=Digitaria exilis TaxID=1010633 RepID=A0A835C560_9POAL|nr:hypothetical protein HU200_028859 [Digitaria exilis]
MADHLLHPPSNDLRLRAQHQRPTKALLKILRIRRLIRDFVSNNVAGHVAAALGGARAVLLHLLSKKAAIELRKKIKRKHSGKNNKHSPCICGCVEMHLNQLLPLSAWPSSPPPWPETTAVNLEPIEAGFYYCYSYYDPSWDTVIPAELQLPPITGYLEWPGDEERQMEEYEDEDEDDVGGCNEIDSLAESFIARCHERFMLEKQESYRRHQEMLARSL